MVFAGRVEFRAGAPFFAHGDRYVRDLRKGGADFILLAYYIRIGGGKRNVVQAAPLFGRGVT